MTKKQFLPTVAGVTLCSLALCNCSTIENYRKDPSEWNQPDSVKPKVEKVAKKSETKKKRGGFFSFFSKFRKDSEDQNKTNARSTASTALVKNSTTSASNPRPQVAPFSASPRNVKQPRVASNGTLPLVKAEKKASSGVKGQRRKVGGLLTPDADKLPTKKDLQEIQSTVPKSGTTNGVNIPVKP